VASRKALSRTDVHGYCGVEEGSLKDEGGGDRSASEKASGYLVWYSKNV
jgi:hypothetical protein